MPSRLIIKGVKISQIERIIEGDVKEAQRGIKLIAQRTKETVLQIINASRIREVRQDKAHHLTENMEVEFFGDNVVFGAGVGAIETLDKNTPYWFLVNFGGKVTKFSGQNHFVPGYFSGNIFVYDRGSAVGTKLPSGLLPSVSFPAMNYIEKTNSFLFNSFGDFMNRQVR